jgi:CheY-like chemotaxis protein
VPRDVDESSPSIRWSEPPPGDPHRDVTGALHDVSNALTVLLGWLAEARSHRNSPERLERALAIVEERARKARDLARRAIGAQSTVDDREDALDAVIDDVIEALSVEAERAGVALVVPARNPGIRIPLAADAIHILTNLLLNALAWAPRGSRVTVEASAEATFVSLLVQDEGPGVPDSEAHHVFSGVTHREGGAGIGLKHARALARAAGGELEVLRGAARPGGRLRLRWPCIPWTARGSLPRLLLGTRVLVVEDDGDVAALLQSALGARGAQVTVARSVGELSQRAPERYDAALVDLSPIADDIPGAVRALRLGSPDVALVFISGSVVGLPDGLDTGRIRWVRKPFEVAEIIAALSETRVIAAAAASGANRA